jgi:hypothetical protein
MLNAIVKRIDEQANVLLADANFPAGSLKLGTLLQHKFGGEFDAHLDIVYADLANLVAEAQSLIRRRQLASSSDFPFQSVSQRWHPAQVRSHSRSGRQQR